MGLFDGVDTVKEYEEVAAVQTQKASEAYATGNQSAGDYATAMADIATARADSLRGNGPSSYAVESGDNLSQIAQSYNNKYGTNYTVDEIAKVNGISNPNEIESGQIITFPKTGSQTTQPSLDAGTTAMPTTHKVQSGETLSSVVRGINTATGGNTMTVEALAILNGIDNLDYIETGQELTLIANKEEVENCIKKLQYWTQLMNGTKESLENALTILDSSIHTLNTSFDNRINQVKNQMNENLNTIITDAEAFQSWMQELSEALDGETRYADTLVGNFGQNPVSEL